MNETGPAAVRRAWFRFTLRTLMVLVLLLGGSLGAFRFGRLQGRRDAQPEIDSLNAECEHLMHRAYSGGSTVLPTSLWGRTPPAPRVYDFSKPQDRADYRQDYADPLHP